MTLKRIKTKLGIASLDNNGYYWITSRKEGNHHKFLHRLIWEDFYGFKIPKGFHIHYKNHIKIDNCILNLQLIKEYDHYMIHNLGENSCWYGRNHSDETKLKAKKYKNGFCWAYQWINEQGKSRRIKARTIDELKQRVLSRNLEWIEY